MKSLHFLYLNIYIFIINFLMDQAGKFSKERLIRRRQSKDTHQFHMSTECEFPVCEIAFSVGSTET